MKSKVTYTFAAKMWQHNPPVGWHFVSLPKKMSSEIRQLFKNQEEGWGRMKATAIINNIQWVTAIWFDTKQEVYTLPIKVEIRKKANMTLNDTIKISIMI